MTTWASPTPASSIAARSLTRASWVVGGYQADIEAGRTYSGILYEERMTRGIMAARGEKVGLGQGRQEAGHRLARQVGGHPGRNQERTDWNDYVIIAQGNHLQHFINGQPDRGRDR